MVKDTAIRHPPSAVVRVLLIEDNPGDVDLLRAILSKETSRSFAVECVDRLQAGLERLAKRGTDVVLLDLFLPDSQGLDTFVRVHTQAPAVPIIVLIGHDSETLALEAVRKGAQDYLIKGRIDGNLLVRALRYASERHRLLAELAQTTQELQASKASFHNVVEKNTDGVIVVDRKGVVRFINPAAEFLFGRKADELLGELFGLPVTAGEVTELDIVRYGGKAGIVEMRVVETEWEGESAYLAALRDITERKRAEERLAYLAQYDDLTGLANRVLFRDRLTQALARADRYERLVAFMFLDLDRFKDINDALGHEVGDLVLKAVAQRLRGCVRQVDTVARLGGDEFGIILEGIPYVPDVATVAQKVLDIMVQPLALDGHDISVTTSIGITIYPCDDTHIDNLLKAADTAMYRAKEQGRNNYQFYTPEMNIKACERLTLEIGLRHALEREEFLLYYQPQVDSHTRQMIGMEALLRWRHPERGLVSPARFIPLLEETGLIIPVGDWVLRTACAQSRAWQDAGLPPLGVAVNLSALQFRQKDLVGTVARVLKDTRLDPHCLQLELTEGILMENTQAISLMLAELKAMGVQISIDDFGTGYSSLSYLKHFPIDILKIDQSFVQGTATDPDDAAIVTAIIALAHSLRLKVIAEGVETEAQLAFLRAQGCDAIQGYLFSRPLPATAFAQWLREGQPAAVVKAV